MTNEEKKFIQDNHTSGRTELFGEVIPYVAVPNMPDREPFTLDEILEALRDGKAEDGKSDD